MGTRRRGRDPWGRAAAPLIEPFRGQHGIRNAGKPFPGSSRLDRALRKKREHGTSPPDPTNRHRALSLGCDLGQNRPTEDVAPHDPEPFPAAGV